MLGGNYQIARGLIMKIIKNKHTIATLTLVVVSSVISISLAEIASRYIFPIVVNTSVEHRIPHSVFGWVLEPGASYLNKMPEDTVRVTYNSTGWRDVEHSFENNRGTFRILVLGDSFMEGYSVNLEDMFHRQIEQLARTEAVDMEVINLGVGGYGTLQEYLVFRDIGQHYKPDIVLLGFCFGNDVRDNSLSLQSMLGLNSMKVKSRPFLDSTEVIEWKIIVTDYDGALHSYLAAKEKGEPFIKKLANKSALIQAMKSVVRHQRMKTKKNKKKEAQEIFVLRGVNYCQEHQEFTNAWVTTKRILNRIKNDVSSIGAKLIVFTVPVLYEVVEEELGKTPGNELICWEEMPAYERLVGILTELDIDYVNLLPGFRKIMRNEKQNLFRRSDGHWNEKGHYTAATIVHSALKDRNLLSFDVTDNSTQQGTAPDHNPAMIHSDR